MSETVYMSGNLSFNSKDSFLNVIDSLELTNHLVPKNGLYHFINSYGEHIDTDSKYGSVDIGKMTINIPASEYKNLSSQILGIINIYRPKGEFITVNSNGDHGIAYKNGKAMTSSFINQNNSDHPPASIQELADRLMTKLCCAA